MDKRSRTVQRSKPIDIKPNGGRNYALSVQSASSIPVVGSYTDSISSSAMPNSSILEDILRPHNLLKRLERSHHSLPKDAVALSPPKALRKQARESFRKQAREMQMHDVVQDDDDSEDNEENRKNTPFRTFKLELTAIFVINALVGRSVLLKRTPAALWRYRIFHSKAWRTMFAIVSVVNLSLALIEEPMYKPQETNNWLCPTPVLLTIEFLCLSIFFADSLLKLSTAPTKYKMCKWSIARFAISCIILLDLSTAVLFYIVGMHVSMSDGTFGRSHVYPYAYIRFSRILRPLLPVLRYRRVRKIFRGATAWAGSVLVMLTLLLLQALFYAVFGYLMFGPNPVLGTWAPYYKTLPISLKNMLQLMTATAYLPDMQAPYIEEWGLLGVAYFLTFELVGKLFLYNLVIAVAYRSYKDFAWSQMINSVVKRKSALKEAFGLMLELELPPPLPNMEKRLSIEIWLELWKYFKKGVKPALARRMFCLVLQQRSNSHRQTRETSFDEQRAERRRIRKDYRNSTLDSKQFSKLCLSCVNIKFVEVSEVENPFLKPLSERPTCKEYFDLVRRTLAWYGTLVLKSPWFTLCTDLLVILSAVQTFYMLRIQFEGGYGTWHVLGNVIMCIFTIELVMKLLLESRKQFWGRPMNVVDFICVFMSLLFNIFYFLLSQSPGQIGFASGKTAQLTWVEVMQVAYCIRLIRFCRVLILIRPIRDVADSLLRILPGLMRAFIVYMGVLYAWSILGLELFCGALTHDGPSPKNLNRTMWWPYRGDLNFDSFLHSGLTFFELSIFSNWFIVMDALTLERRQDFTSIFTFFMIFHIVVVMITLPLLMGFVIQSFLSQWNPRPKKMLADIRSATKGKSKRRTRHGPKGTPGQRSMQNSLSPLLPLLTNTPEGISADHAAGPGDGFQLEDPLGERVNSHDPESDSPPSPSRGLCQLCSRENVRTFMTSARAVLLSMFAIEWAKEETLAQKSKYVEVLLDNDGGVRDVDIENPGHYRMPSDNNIRAPIGDAEREEMMVQMKQNNNSSKAAIRVSTVFDLHKGINKENEQRLIYMARCETYRLELEALKQHLHRRKRRLHHAEQQASKYKTRIKMLGLVQQFYEDKLKQFLRSAGFRDKTFDRMQEELRAVMQHAKHHNDYQYNHYHNMKRNNSFSPNLSAMRSPSMSEMVRSPSMSAMRSPSMASAHPTSPDLIPLLQHGV